SVRYRSERHASGAMDRALLATGRGMAGPLLLAAASIATAFYSFLPTAYLGLSELGLIAGTGIIIAFVTTVTLLPALLAVLNPSSEQSPIGYAALAPLDRFLDKQRNWIVGVTLAATVLGLPLLAGLRFDFNPLNLRAQDTESIATLLELMHDPDNSPNTIEVLKSDLVQASALAARLRQLPEVGRVLTLQSFVPEDQEAKLALIEDANFFLQNTLNPDQIDGEPTCGETQLTSRNPIPGPVGRGACSRRPRRRAGPPLGKSTGCIGESAARHAGRGWSGSGRALENDAAPSETSPDRRAGEHRYAS